MTKKKIIIDCDPGYDDAVALLLAAGHPDVEVLAVTTVAGNQTIEKVTRNALRVGAFCGLKGIPFAAGAKRPLLRPAVVPAPEIHGETGLDGCDLPDVDVALDTRSAAQLIVDIVMREPAGTVTLVPTGPLTNVALAARIEPAIVERVKEVVLMGGAARTGNVTPCAEFNIENDPEAGAIVFGESWPVTMIGLDVTYQARAGADLRARFAARGDAHSKFLTDVLEGFAAMYRSARGYDEPPVHDACAVGYVIDPTIFTTRNATIAVECAGKLTTGMTVCDLRDPEPATSHQRVALSLNRDRFWGLIIEALDELAKKEPA